MRQRWPTLIPLFLLIGILVSGRTPYLAAFTGITSCAIVGLTTRASGNRARNWALLSLLHALLAVIAFGDLGSTASGSSWGCSPPASAVALAGWKLAGITGRIGTACWSRPSRPAPSTRWPWAPPRPPWAS